MTPEAIRIAIAEHCGFVWYRLPPKVGLDADRRYRFLALPAIQESSGQIPVWMIRADGTERMCNWYFMETYCHVPRYLEDLNAMHSAIVETFKDSISRLAFHKALATIVATGSPHFPGYNIWDAENATAAQRAEAFVRAIGKWVDE